MKFVSSDYVVDPTTHAVRISGLKWQHAPIVVKYTPMVSIYSFYQYTYLLKIKKTDDSLSNVVYAKSLKWQKLK